MMTPTIFTFWNGILLMVVDKANEKYWSSHSNLSLRVKEWEKGFLDGVLVE